MMSLSFWRKIAKKSKFLAIFFLLFIVSASSFPHPEKQYPVSGFKSDEIYDELGLAKMGLQKTVFEKALAGWKKLRVEFGTSGILTVADLSQSSNTKRLYVIDVQNRKVLFNTFVAHGRNSGDEYAHSFSNTAESYRSSLGFYLTGNTYSGKHGFSLQLKGLESGINDCAEKRAIVMHGADYVSEDFIRKYGRLGRSLGCPAISTELSQPIIDCIKGGSCLFMYGTDKTYNTQSTFIRPV